ncbi:sedoheptulokinase [Brachionus plicatilis]|uniref:Sedoheptulokinase n=1 Tax=Brachionus plicatilis TaxID=10195 RepID=A0A3M7SVW4_BRAPC|nr:sedoheptulokinase [Brachionus plicatilis]
MKNLILGVDIGTSSVKVVILNSLSGHIEHQESYSTSSAKIKSNNPKLDEQDVKIILEIVNKAFDCLPPNLLKQIRAVQICGQMHGVVLWNKSTRTHSNLITWQDERCDENFLKSLPVKSKSDLSSGFGCASLFWLTKNNQINPEFDSAGTIHDYLTFLLAGKNVMSDQNALSWGFFDLHKNKWQDELFSILELKCESFPGHLLPKTDKPGFKISDCVTLLNSVKLDAEIFNALGDLQASVLSCLEKQTDCGILVQKSKNAINTLIKE